MCLSCNLHCCASPAKWRELREHEKKADGRIAAGVINVFLYVPSIALGTGSCEQSHCEQYSGDDFPDKTTALSKHSSL